LHKSIQAIQTSADQSARLVDESAQSTEKATDFANQSGLALQEIVSMVDSSADQVRAIATASEQQSATSEEINRSITEVNTMTEETSSAMREAAKAVEELVNQAHVLSTLVGDMKKG
jgi:methyl-accepting chemotaxis protein